MNSFESALMITDEFLDMLKRAETTVYEVITAKCPDVATANVARLGAQLSFEIMQNNVQLWRQTAMTNVMKQAGRNATNIN